MFWQCRLCGRGGQDLNALCDGSAYHEACYQQRLGALQGFETEARQVRERLPAIEREIAAEHGAIRFIARLLLGSESREADLRTELEMAEARRAALPDKISVATIAMEQVWDYWLTYPPDWDRRRVAVLARDGRCVRCRAESGLLHVHHRVPVSRGGNHRAENLEALCENCHSNVHGGRTFRYDEKDKRPGAFGVRLGLLRDAIAAGRLVHFQYLARDGERTTRTIGPTAFSTWGRTLCVVGFCYLRNAERVFAVKRIRGLRVVDSPGVGGG